MSLFTSNHTKREAEEVSTSNNIVGKGTTIKGDLEAIANIRFEGNLIGSIKCKSKIVISESANIEGNVFATNAEIAGNLTGNIEISDTLVLKSNCKIKGDIKTGKLIIESGAYFEGNCKMHTQVRKSNPMNANAELATA